MHCGVYGREKSTSKPDTTNCSTFTFSEKKKQDVERDWPPECAAVFTEEKGPVALIIWGVCYCVNDGELDSNSNMRAPYDCP